MLGGLDEVQAADLAASLDFLDELFGKELLSFALTLSPSPSLSLSLTLTLTPTPIPTPTLTLTR